MTVEHEGQRVTYRSGAELRQAIRDAEAALNAEAGQRPVRAVRVRTRSGF